MKRNSHKKLSLAEKNYKYLLDLVDSWNFPCRYDGCKEKFLIEKERYAHEVEHKKAKADGEVVSVDDLPPHIKELALERQKEREAEETAKV